jgi:hypothetical protein
LKNNKPHTAAMFVSLVVVVGVLWMCLSAVNAAEAPERKHKAPSKVRETIQVTSHSRRVRTQAELDALAASIKPQLNSGKVAPKAAAHRVDVSSPGKLNNQPTLEPRFPPPP